MLICRVLFVLDLLPFASGQIMLVSSYCNTDGCAPSFFIIDLAGQLVTCCSINSFTHITKFIASSTPFFSATVELVELTFCLFESENTVSLPNVTMAPVWLFISLYTANEASILQRSILDASHPIINGRCTVSRRYLMTLVSCRQPLSVGSLTLVHK